MSLWRFTDKQIKIGDKIDEYWVVDIQQRIPIYTLIGNYNIRCLNQRGQQPPISELPETPQQCVQLVASPQLIIPGVK